jgi:opacity protein-like surface antigen
MNVLLRAPQAARTLSCVVLLLSVTALCRAQQPYVGRYDIYTGFSDLNTPGLNSLNQVGFNLQAGANVNRMLGVGFDYSVQAGDTSLTANLATPALQAQLAALAAEFAELGLLPAGYTLRIPLHAVTQTFTVGGQYEYRHFSRATLFIRPSLSAFRIKATPHPDPQDLYGTTVANILAPDGSLTDWTGAYGAGGGGEFNITKHVAARAQLDVIWNHPFNSILANGFWSYRYSVGPAFHFGHNVPEHGHHTKS